MGERRGYPKSSGSLVVHAAMKMSISPRITSPRVNGSTSASSLSSRPASTFWSLVKLRQTDEISQGLLRSRQSRARYGTRAQRDQDRDHTPVAGAGVTGRRSVGEAAGRTGCRRDNRASDSNQSHLTLGKRTKPAAATDFLPGRHT